ncbi:MAG TPA: TetR/AcrR family transcriptional regulator [Rhodobacteraceae bacterium]|nr:TetR/AcrR family transcriptional regulator [Paracoccaceae bacterium]
MTQPLTPTETRPDGKALGILRAAFEVFARYGVRRTSMQDIAREAGMSRAALYLHFRNKDDIVQSLARHYYDQARADVRAALAAHPDPAAALDAAFAAQGGEGARLILTSPHGAELLDAKQSHCAEIVAEGEAALAAIYAAWLDRLAGEGRVTLDAAEGDTRAVAETMLVALHGLKAGAPDYDSYRASAARLARLFGQGLRPR